MPVLVLTAALCVTTTVCAVGVAALGLGLNGGEPVQLMRGAFQERRVRRSLLLLNSVLLQQSCTNLLQTISFLSWHTSPNTLAEHSVITITDPWLNTKCVVHYTASQLAEL